MPTSLSSEDKPVKSSISSKYLSAIILFNKINMS